ncbi:hypothetical protein Strvi_9257 (plasmid) [Streptomyces violaceusniger Tu 4113]|uniref:Uncharacterized protein n=1 Tax=Streptomyces violaceusniger (strain Tu 4113) TaxID=653045 RepID=G2PGP8_STRV4|nr:hypothetical protein Strvi_9257 [Streptomyces violaceusniger Tu 4113]
MVFREIRTALSIVGGTLRGRVSGMWYTIRTWVEGRNAVAFERERRSTLLAVPATLHQGGRIYDQRADGSVLEIAVPAPGHSGVIIGESARRHSTASTPPALPSSSRPALPGTEEQ